MASVLIIDDDPMLCEMVGDYVESINHHYEHAHTLREGLSRLTADPFDLVLLDVRLPDGNGLEAMPSIRQAPGEPVVIIITGEADPEGAELAIKNGAWDYLQKPLSIVNLTLPLERALQFREEKKTRESLIVIDRKQIIGDSPRFNQCLGALARAASCDANTLINGETGTGKEQFAKAIHKNGDRRNKSFVVVDCAALPETLVESTLFGHEKGAFTGAERAEEGLVRMADGGTLFLDEVGELSNNIQKAFLRVLQERRFRPVGGKKEVKSNFRLIAATNKNLDNMVKDGSFREDLLFRLRSISITLPPLRERNGDIKKLALHFMADLCERYGVGTKAFSPELLDILLKKYKWPGNVRELAAAVVNLIATAGKSPVLYPDHLPTYIRAEVARSNIQQENRSKGLPMEDDGDRQVLGGSFRAYREAMIQKIEHQYLENLMVVTQWNIKQACSMAELSRPRLYALLKKHSIVRPS